MLLPEKFSFSTLIDVRITDINYGGHLGNDSVLGIIHEARVRLFADKGFTEKDIDGNGIIMTDTVINYISEGFLGDRLKIDVTVDDITNSSCDIFYHITNIKSDKEIVKAKTNIGFYNYDTRKVCRIPKIFLDAFQNQ